MCPLLSAFKPRPLDRFITNNLLPLIDQLKAKTTQWMSLPIDLMGRVDLLKMHFFPKFLYILTQAPCLIPRRYFQTIDSICIFFLWQDRASCITLYTLQSTMSQQVLAFPNLYIT